MLKTDFYIIQIGKTQLGLNYAALKAIYTGVYYRSSYTELRFG